MNSKKNNRRSLFYSVISLLLCVSMLMGTTLAWFSDSVSSTGNIIKTGRLKVEMHYADSLTGEWKDASEATIFNGNLWEPGYSDMKFIKVSNTGNLAFSYQMHILPAVQAVAGQANLADVIDVYIGAVGDDFVEPTAFSPDMPGLSRQGTLTEVMARDPMTGVLLPADGGRGTLPEGVYADTGDVTYCVILHMKETAGNEYQDLDFGNNFTIQLVAAQYGYELDNFGGNYDADATYPDLKFPEMMDMDMGSAEITVDSENKLTAPVTLKGAVISATVPAGVLVEEGVTELTLIVEEMDETTSNITLGEGEEMRSLDVHVAGVSAENTVPMIISLGAVAPEYLNQGNLNLAHVENGVTVLMTRVEDLAALDAHNEYYYDVLTGELTVAMATFSEVAVRANTENAWKGVIAEGFAGGTGTEKDPYLIANADQLAAFGAIVGGMVDKTQKSFSGEYVKLLSDINLGDDEDNNDPDKIFYPIGYYNSEGTYERTNTAITSGLRNFEGTFDGNGHTISNFYHNTWEMKGDHNWYSPEEQYYRDGMGLFGRVYGGTIKNLTVRNFKSDGEIATTGVIAAYADFGATFENIAIFDCNPRVYNIGNGGIVGCVGWYTKGETDKKVTFKNITVDNSNKISALWGSYDVACGGLVGQYYPTSGQKTEDGNAIANAGIDMVNCHVSAIMDVYNDVCANYQYYAYRYAGMMIGSIRENTTIEIEGVTKTIPNMAGISAEKCTVNYGDWNDYYYCEFEKNGHPSYSGPDDYKFSRVPHSELKFTDSNGNGLVDADERASVTGCKHNHTDAEDNKAIYLPFHQLFTGYGWGVNSIGLEKYSGIVTNLDITEGDQEGSVYKFESAFPNSMVNKETGEVQTKFLYRVGTLNEVSVGTLFKAIEGANITSSGVHVTITSQHNDKDIMGSFTANASNWKDGKLKFDKTGIVKVTIQDYIFCKPTVLYLEVVEAWNTTGAENAPKSYNGKNYDVVLLQNADAGSLTVKDGYSFYGNGFTLKFNGDGSYRSAALSYGFVTVENGGILDNTRVVCKVFPTSYMYTHQMDPGNDGRYPYGYSAVIVKGNSTVSNCYIYGARNNIHVAEGNVLINNTITECASVANIHIEAPAGNTVTLRDITTIQRLVDDEFNAGNTMLGFGILVGMPESTSHSTIKFEGDLNQYNWVTAETKEKVSDGYTKMAIQGALDAKEYQHKTNNGVTTVNMGVAILTRSVALTIDDEQCNMKDIYALGNITINGSDGRVYSIKAGIVSEPSVDNEVEIGDAANRAVLPNVVAAQQLADGVTLETAYDNNEQKWVSTLDLDLDNISGGSYSFSFDQIKVQKYGYDLEFTVKDASGNAVDKSANISFGSMENREYTLVVTDDKIYDYGGKDTELVETRELSFVIHATKTSIEPPKFTNAGTATAIRLVDKSGGDWRPAYTVLTGVSVTYWSASESKVKTVDLSTLYNSGKISSNVWTYTCDDYTLTITGGQVHSDGSKITPVVSNNTLYFASTNKAFTTKTTSRDIKLTYVFTDKNASTTWDRTESVVYSNLSEYDYSKFKNGTLEAPSSGSSCVTPDTLITLADGTQKRVDSLTGNEELLVWNMETGKLDSAPIMFLDNDPAEEVEVATMYFSDGTDVKVIYEHGFWDYDLNKYVYLDANAADYIGHTFAKQNGDELAKVQLIDVVIETEVTTAWSPVTAGHLCYFVNGMLSMPGGVGGLFNIFDVDPETMTYDLEAMARDIEKYGLFTYEEMNEIVPLPEEMFEAAGGAYLKVSIGKGNMTMDDLVYMIERYTKFFG